MARKTVNDMANAVIIDAIAPAPEFRTAYDQLKPTERAFVDAYLVTDEPVGAAFAAFPDLAAAGMSDRRAVSAAGARALEFSRRPLIQAAIAEKMAAKAAEWDLRADKVVAEIAKIAYSNLDDYLSLTSDGEPYIDLSKVPRDKMAAVAEVTVEDYVEGRGEDARDVKRVKFKLHPKLDALEKAMKYLGLYAPDKVDMRVAGTITTTPAGPTAITHAQTTAEAAEAYARSLAEDA